MQNSRKEMQIIRLFLWQKSEICERAASIFPQKNKLADKNDASWKNESSYFMVSIYNKLYSV